MATFLDLSHNNLHSISREIFISASKLENLNLSNNLLSQTPPELYLPALKIFSLNNNPLSILNLCKLKGLQQLLNLMVNNNSIMEFQKIKFSLIGEESSQKILKLSDFLFSSYQREEIGHLNLNPCASTAQYIDSDRGAECPPLEKCNALKQRFVGIRNWLSIDLDQFDNLRINLQPPN